MHEVLCFKWHGKSFSFHFPPAMDIFFYYARVNIFSTTLHKSLVFTGNGLEIKTSSTFYYLHNCKDAKSLLSVMSILQDKVIN